MLVMACGPVAGCSATGPSRPAAPCAQVAVETSAPERTGLLRRVPVGRMPASGDGSLGYVRLWERHVGFTPQHNSIAVCNLGTGRATRVAAVEGTGPASLDWMDGSDDVVVYSKLASVPDLSSPDPKAEWTIELFDLRTRKTRRIAQSAGRGGPETNFSVLPKPVVDGRSVAWVGVPGPPDRGGDIVTHDVSTGTRRAVASGVFPGTVGLWDGLVVYDDVSDRGRDIFVVPVDGSGPPRRVTTTGTVTFPTFANGWAAWQEVIEARRKTSEGNYRVDIDPVWAVSLTGGEPIRFERGQYPVAGDGFVLTHVANRGLVAYDIARPTDEPLLVAPDDTVDSASRWDVEGAVAVWTAPDGSVELARIERG